MIQHKLLLGSTALAGAGVLLTGTAPARADIEVVLGGFTEFGVVAGSQEHRDKRRGRRRSQVRLLDGQ